MDITATKQSGTRPRSFMEPSVSVQTTRTDLALLTSSKHLGLRLVTTEGDKVTLSLDARAALLSAEYEQLHDDGHGSRSLQNSRFEMDVYHREITFNVEGELNKAEKRDVRKVIHQLDRIMHRLPVGPRQADTAPIDKRQDLKTIAGYEAHLSFDSLILQAQQNQTLVGSTQNAETDTSRSATGTLLPSA